MRTPIRSVFAVAAVALLAAACSGAAATGTPVVTVSPTNAAAPSDSPAATFALIPTPNPTTDGVGPEYVTGVSSLTVTKPGTETVVGDVTQLRGQEMVDSGPMNDPRLVGTSHLTLNADIYGAVGSEWGTTRIENAGGAWEGTWTGAAWNTGSATTVSGWLVGSGAYAGYTYYFHAFGASNPYQMEGIIFKGAPPMP
jgi:hypothetical protein